LRGQLDRRQFVFRAAAVGAGTIAIAGPRASTARAATDDDLAFANFGIAAELLLADFYAKTLAIKDLDRPTRATLRAGKLAAGKHAQALGDLLVGAGQTAPEPDDFAFVWPTKTFKTLASATAAGLDVLRPTMGAYLTAAVSVTEPTYRVLFTSLAGSLGQQAGALAGPAGVEQFPVAISLESASGKLEGYLG
jgi:hypothetical protein